MKMDDDVKMISAEAPLLFAKAAQMFITGDLITAGAEINRVIIICNIKATFSYLIACKFFKWSSVRSNMLVFHSDIGLIEVLQNMLTAEL